MKTTVFALILTALALTGCGYKLRGLESNAQQSNTIVTPIISSDNARLAQAIHHELTTLGIKQTVQEGAPTITISDTTLQKYELVGVLTETRLVLSAKVRYNNQTYTPMVSRSYQYNKAGLNSSDDEAPKVEAWLYEELARQISEQYYALAKHSPNQ